MKSSAATPAPLSTFGDIQGDPYRWSAKVGRGDTVTLASPFIIVTHWGRRMQVFGNGCGRPGSTCRPLWQSARKVNDVTVRGRRIYATEAFPAARGEQGGIAMYRTNCYPVHGICQPEWFDTVGPINTARSRSDPQQFGVPTRFTTPVVTEGVVYAAGALEPDQSHPGAVFAPLYAFPSRCPNTACAPLWRTGGHFGSGPPLVRDEVVYLPSSSGLFAYPASCRSDRQICPPLWHGATNIDGNKSNYIDRPVVRGGEVLVTTEGDVGGGDSVPASLYAFPVGCRADGGTCIPDWWSMIDKRTRWTSRPLVSAGRVIVSSASRGLVEFPLHCGSGAAICRRRTYLGNGHSAYGGELPGPALLGDQVLAGASGDAFKPANGLATFDVVCPKLRCPPILTWSPESRLGTGWTSTPEAVFASEPGLVMAFRHAAAAGGRPNVFWRWAIPRGKEASDIAAGPHNLFIVSDQRLYAVSYPSARPTSPS